MESGSVVAIAGPDQVSGGSRSSSRIGQVGRSVFFTHTAACSTRAAVGDGLPTGCACGLLPGMAALNAWDLTPPGPMWGLRGLAVLDGLVLDQTPALSVSNRSRKQQRFAPWPTSRRFTHGWRRSHSGSVPT